MLEGDHPIIVATIGGGVAIIWRFPIAAMTPDGRVLPVRIDGVPVTGEGLVPEDWQLIYLDAASEVEKSNTVSTGYISYREARKADIPADKTFRPAWVDDGRAISIDMPKARAIHMGRIRKVRDKELAKLDVATIQALGRGEINARDIVEAQKQVLRDLPQTFDLLSFKTAEDLKAAWPSDLPTMPGL